MGELVLVVFSTCSSRKLQRQLTSAVKVGRSAIRVHIEVRVTIECQVNHLAQVEQ